jgi:hypothetical protein
MSDSRTTELIVKGSIAILGCASVRSTKQYEGSIVPSFSRAFESCQNEYHQYLNTALTKKLYSK